MSRDMRTLLIHPLQIKDGLALTNLNFEIKKLNHRDENDLINISVG